MGIIKFGSQPFSFLGKLLGTKYDEAKFGYDEKLTENGYLVLAFNGDKTSQKGKRYFEPALYDLKAVGGFTFKDGFLLAQVDPSFADTGYSFNDAKVFEEWKSNNCLIAIQCNGHKLLEFLNEAFNPDSDTNYLFSFGLILPSTQDDESLPNNKDAYVKYIKSKFGGDEFELSSDDIDDIATKGLDFDPFIEADVKQSKRALSRYGLTYVNLTENLLDVSKLNTKSSGKGGGYGGKGSYFKPEDRQAFVNSELAKFGINTTNSLTIIQDCVKSPEKWFAMLYTLNLSGSYTPDFSYPYAIATKFDMRTTNFDDEVDESSEGNEVEDQNESSEEDEDTPTDANETIEQCNKIIEDLKTKIGTVPSSWTYPDSVPDEELIEWSECIVSLVNDFKLDLKDATTKKKLKALAGTKKGSIVSFSLEELNKALDALEAENNEDSVVF